MKNISDSLAYRVELTDVDTMKKFSFDVCTWIEKHEFSLKDATKFCDQAIINLKRDVTDYQTSLANAEAVGHEDDIAYFTDRLISRYLEIENHEILIQAIKDLKETKYGLFITEDTNAYLEVRKEGIVKKYDNYEVYRNFSGSEVNFYFNEINAKVETSARKIEEATARLHLSKKTAVKVEARIIVK